MKADFFGPAPPIPVMPQRSWEQFKGQLLNYVRQPRSRRSQFLFRGQGDSNWPLLTTLDRRILLRDDGQRDRLIKTLLDEFKREAALLRSNRRVPSSGEGLELLARHHGLPSQLIDWTESPYIASFFAFAGAGRASSARVWVLDRAALSNANDFDSSVDLIDDRILLRYNQRALQQRGVFLKVTTAGRSLTELLYPALYAFDLSASDRATALADLDAMNINATTLFDDFEGAARTVSNRVFVEVTDANSQRI